MAKISLSLNKYDQNMVEVYSEDKKILLYIIHIDMIDLLFGGKIYDEIKTSPNLTVEICAEISPN